MKNLIEISKIVTKRKVRKIEIFDNHSLKHKSSKFNEFYEALSANKYKNDRDAASHLYGCSPTDPKYRQLKSRFRKRLLNTLFFLDINKPSAAGYQRAYYTCNKDWTLVKILMANGAHQTGTSLAKQILTIALRFKFADTIVNCARILRAYSVQSLDEKSFDLYDEYIKQYSSILEAEIKSEEIYQRVTMIYYKTVDKIHESIDQMQDHCDALISLSERFDSPIIFYNMFLVWIIRYEIQQDFEAMLEVCAQAEHYIELNPQFYHEEKLIIFHTKKMSAYLHLKEYKKGKANAEKCLNSFPEGGHSWFNFMEFYLLLAIHTENYIHALAIFNRTVNHNNFNKLDGVTKEKWATFEAYLHFIVENQGFNASLLIKPKGKTFKVNRFMNKAQIYPKDQRIFTLLQIILQILFLLQRKTHSGIEDRIERLKNYANRQLKKEEYFRIIQFIRLLQQLRKVDFQVDEISQSNKYHSRLLERPFAYRGIISELEVIPYEKLWLIIQKYFE